MDYFSILSAFLHAVFFGFALKKKTIFNSSNRNIYKFIENHLVYGGSVVNIPRGLQQFEKKTWKS